MTAWIRILTNTASRLFLGSSPIPQWILTSSDADGFRVVDGAFVLLDGLPLGEYTGAWHPIPSHPIPSQSSPVQSALLETCTTA